MQIGVFMLAAAAPVAAAGEAVAAAAGEAAEEKIGAGEDDEDGEEDAEDCGPSVWIERDGCQCIFPPDGFGLGRGWDRRNAGKKKEVGGKGGEYEAGKDERRTCTWVCPCNCSTPSMPSPRRCRPSLIACER